MVNFSSHGVCPVNVWEFVLCPSDPSGSVRVRPGPSGSVRVRPGPSGSVRVRPGPSGPSGPSGPVRVRPGPSGSGWLAGYITHYKWRRRGSVTLPAFFKISVGPPTSYHFSSTGNNSVVFPAPRHQENERIEGASPQPPRCGLYTTRYALVVSARFE